jgi:hypothetical protein
MPAHPLETYLADCAATRATGAATDETAYYPALKDLLDAAGRNAQGQGRGRLARREAEEGGQGARLRV